jgi:hypothetical protein
VQRRGVEPIDALVRSCEELEEFGDDAAVPAQRAQTLPL